MFIAFVLDSFSKNKLLIRSCPQHKVVFAHHVTLAFNPDERDLLHWAPYFGMNGLINIGNRFFDEKGEAFLVEPRVHFPEMDTDEEDHTVSITKSLPHLTFSCREGTPPKYSNDLLSPDNLLKRTEVKEFKLFLTGEVKLLP